MCNKNKNNNKNTTETTPLRITFFRNFRTPRGLAMGLVRGEGLRCGGLLKREGEWSLLPAPPSPLPPHPLAVSGVGLLVRERCWFFLALRSTGGREMLEPLLFSSTTSLLLYNTRGSVFSCSSSLWSDSEVGGVKTRSN